MPAASTIFEVGCRCGEWSRDARQRRSLMSVRAPRSIWVATYRERLEAGRPSRGAEHLTTGEHANFLLTLIERQSDLTLDEVFVSARDRRSHRVASSGQHTFKKTHARPSSNAPT